MDINKYIVCVDCYQLEGTGDSSFLDYHYGYDAAERLKEIESGYNNLLSNGGHLSTGDDISDFSGRPCDCCGSKLAGSRHELIVLK